jgi:hypothetical protein
VKYRSIVFLCELLRPLCRGVCHSVFGCPCFRQIISYKTGEHLLVPLPLDRSTLRNKLVVQDAQSIGITSNMFFPLYHFCRTLVSLGDDGVFHMELSRTNLGLVLKTPHFACDGLSVKVLMAICCCYRSLCRHRIFPTSGYLVRCVGRRDESLRRVWQLSTEIPTCSAVVYAV